MEGDNHAEGPMEAAANNPDSDISTTGVFRHFVWDPRVRRENYDFLIGIFRIRLF